MRVRPPILQPSRLPVPISLSLSLSSSPYKQDDEGRTALHVAIDGGHLAVVRLLLRYGADPMLVDRRDQANGFAYAQRRPDPAPYLRELGAAMVDAPSLSQSSLSSTSLSQEVARDVVHRAARRPPSPPHQNQNHHYHHDHGHGRPVAAPSSAPSAPTTTAPRRPTVKHARANYTCATTTNATNTTTIDTTTNTTTMTTAEAAKRFIYGNVRQAYVDWTALVMMGEKQQQTEKQQTEKQPEKQRQQPFRLRVGDRVLVLASFPHGWSYGRRVVPAHQYTSDCIDGWFPTSTCTYFETHADLLSMQRALQLATTTTPATAHRQQQHQQQQQQKAPSSHGQRRSTPDSMDDDEEKTTLKTGTGERRFARQQPDVFPATMARRTAATAVAVPSGHLQPSVPFVATAPPPPVATRTLRDGQPVALFGVVGGQQAATTTTTTTTIKATTAMTTTMKATTPTATTTADPLRIVPSHAELLAKRKAILEKRLERKLDELQSVERQLSGIGIGIALDQPLE